MILDKFINLFGCNYDKTLERAKWELVLKLLYQILDQGDKFMKTLEELKGLSETQLAKIDVLNTALDGFRVAMDAIRAELADLKTRDLTPAQQEQVDVIAGNMEAAITKIEETLAENVPQPPPPPPVFDS